MYKMASSCLHNPGNVYIIEYLGAFEAAQCVQPYLRPWFT